MNKWIAFLFLFSCMAFAQNVSSSLAGTLLDASGAVIPGQEIKLADARTGFVSTTRSNHEGFFSFPRLAPSTYKLTITAPGFKVYSQDDIELSAAEQRTLGVIRMEIGMVNDSIAVVADANRVMLASGERASQLTGGEVSNIAVRGRDFVDVIGLLPGVVDTASSREAPSPSSIDQVNILGGRSSSKNVTVDGTSILNTGANTTVHTMPSMDTIAEVKVLMSNYSAEYGRSSGGTIMLVTKGGAAQFHGSAGWYYRHEDLTANDFFNNRNGVGRPRYRYNIASYTLGGPVYVPHKFNHDRSKLFFFFAQEFQRQLVSYGTRTVTVPTERERAGDFSGSFDLNGKLIPIYDSFNNRAPFPGNAMPLDRLTPVGRSILNLFPKPNFVDPSPSRLYQWNYISALSGGYNRRAETLRVDYAPRANTQFYGTFVGNSDEQHPPYGLFINGPINFPLNPARFRQPGNGLSLHATTTLSPTLVNEFIFGWSTDNISGVPLYPEQVNRQATGITIPQFSPAANPDGLIPDMSFGGVSNYANPSNNNWQPFYSQNRSSSFVENLNKIQGTHTLKAGFYLERTSKDQSSQTANRGTIAFDRDINNPLDTNHAYANALLGIYSTYSEATLRPFIGVRFTNLEAYVQDGWRVTHRLYLDYGVRFYHDMPATDARGQFTGFLPSLYNPANAPVLLRPGFDPNGKRAAIDPSTGTAYPVALIGAYVPNVGDPAAGMVVGGKKDFPRGLYTVPAVSVAPRFGFAWDPFGRQRTSLRGGAGVFYDRVPTDPSVFTVKNPPIVYVPTVYYGTIDQLKATSGQRILAPPPSVSSLSGEQRLPVVYNYSLGIQQQLGSSRVLDISYVGSVSRHLERLLNINPVPIDANFLDKNPQNADPTLSNRPLSPNFLRPYRGYGDINVYGFGASANYNSLQVGLTQRRVRGIQLGLAYTFSKALGTASSDGTYNNLDRASPFYPARLWKYGPLAFDRSHVFSLRYNWALPKLGQKLNSRILKLVADEWELAGITRIQSGAPFTPGFSTVDGMDFTGTPSEAARPLVVDPSAPAVTRFGRPVRGTLGNAGVGILRGLGMNNWDASLYRRVPLGSEKRYLQLRLESYNTPNHTQFSNVSQSARFDQQGAQIDTLFLQPTAARSARKLQLAVRLYW